VFRNIKIAGLCLASMLVMGMALAGSANAAPLLWLVCLEGTGLTKYTGSSCATLAGRPNSEPGWQSLGLLPGQSDTVRILSFTITLTDTKATGGESKIRCLEHVTSWGLIENSGKGKQFTAEVANPKANCAVIKGGCKAGEVESVKGAHLPWTTEVVEEGGKGLIQIVSGTGGEPGWTVRCNTLLGKQEDTCEGLEHAFAENQVTEGVLLVLAEFANLKKGKCSQSKAVSGEVEGKFAILLAGGGPLSLNR